MSAPVSFPHAETMTPCRLPIPKRGPRAPAADPRVCDGTPSSPVTVFAYSHESNIDRLSARVTQLRALLSSMSGSGFQNFKELNDSLQGNLMWLADELADEIEALTWRVSESEKYAGA